MQDTIKNTQTAALAETGRYYKHICWMALPLVCMSAYLYGLRPVRRGLPVRRAFSGRKRNP